MDQAAARRRSFLRIGAIAATGVLGMFAAYQLGYAHGPLVLLIVPLPLAAFVIGTLAMFRSGDLTSADMNGWERFQMELERSRRHERPLALLRITVPRHRSGSALAAFDAAAVRGAVRVLDGAWADGDHVFVLMPEADRSALARAIERIVARFPGIGSDAIRAALYPDDGLTGGALIARLEAPDAVPLPADIVQLKPASLDAEPQTQTG